MMKDIIFNDTAFEFFHCNYTSDCQEDMTNNKVFRIWYIKRGNVKLVGNKTTIEAKAGDTLYIPKEEKCIAYFSGNKPITILKYNFLFFPSINNYAYPAQIVNTNKEILSLMQEIPIKSSITSITLWKFYQYLNEIQKKLVTVDHKRIKKIEIALEYMNTHDNYDIPTLAKLCNMSESGFYATFREVVGRTPIEEKHYKQATKAETLLCSTDLSIDEIALKVGFQSTQYFRKIFKKCYGVTPNEMRKNRLM